VQQLHQLPVFSGTQIPPELVTAHRALLRHLDEPGRADSIKRVLASPEIQLVKSPYTGLSEFHRLHAAIFSAVSDLKSSDEYLSQDKTDDFHELSDPLTTDRKRILYTFPMYLTESKRSRFSVLAYGRQRELGLLVPPGSTVLSRQRQYQAQNDWNLATILQHVASNTRGVVLCLKNYATKEIAIQCATSNQKCEHFTLKQLQEIDPSGNFVTSSARRRTRRSQKPKRVTRLVPGETAGDDWVFLFDLGNLSEVEKECKDHDDLKFCQIVRIQHGLDIPVGIGFNLYLVPWLLEDSRWRRLRQLVLDAASPLAESLRKTGIEFGEGQQGATEHVVDIESAKLYPLPKFHKR
jgi:hypothetical protein